MSTITFDTDAIIQRLRRAGLSEEQAREFVHALRDAQAELVTKVDLREALSELKADLLKWLLPILLAQAGLIVTLVKVL